MSITMNALRHRTVDRENYTWAIEVYEVHGHTPYSRQATVKRNGELWLTVKRKHNGTVRLIPALVSRVTPESVIAEVKKDLDVPNA